MGNAASGTNAAAAFHAVTSKKLYSKTPLLILNSFDNASLAVVMAVEFIPAQKVTASEVTMTIHFFHKGQL